MEEFDAVESFRTELKEYLDEYQEHLLRDFKKETVNRHGYVLAYCIDYLCSYHGVKGFEDITFAMVSSKMYYDFKTNTHEDMSRKTVFNIVKKYFEFIYSRYGIRNPQLMIKMEKAKV